MKNLVISRKGFDASSGGRASPIFANGDIFSVPIPQKKQSPSRHGELQFNDMSGRQILNFIGAKSISGDDWYHNDPLFSGQKGIFWQAGLVTRGIREIWSRERRPFFIFWMV